MISFHFFRWPVAFVLLTVFSCTSVPLEITVAKLNQSSPHLASNTDLWQKFKNKPVYRNPLEVAIHTDLLNPGVSNAKHIPFLTVAEDFRTQAVPAGPIVFQEAFTKTQANLELIRGFRIPDTSKRYSLHVQINSQALAESDFSLNINGTDRIRSQDFENQEAEKSGLLLNANNSLRVQVNGAQTGAFTVSLVEGGDAGTVLKRNGLLRLPDETHATRIQQNDTNIFDPNDPNSLGGLQPYEGHLTAENASPNVTGVAVDGLQPVQFEAGTLVLRLRQPEIILPILSENYGAQIIHKIEVPEHPDFTYYYLSFDLNKSPLAQTETLIRRYRDKIPAQFNDFVFASVSGLKTFVILLDILDKYESHIATWELNSYQDPPLAAVEPKDWNAQNISPVGAVNQGWWLRDTFVKQAWNYSLGTGVKVGYIDSGFRSALSNGNTPHPEYGQRLLSEYSLFFQNLMIFRWSSIVRPLINNRLDCEERNPSIKKPNASKCDYAHGTTTSMAGFAQRNNGMGTAGVAPNAELIPFAADGYIFTRALALSFIYLDHKLGKRYDVIGYNKQDQTPIGWTPAYNAPDNPGNDPYSMTILRMHFDLLSTDAGIPIVVAAGNDGSRCPNGSVAPTKGFDAAGNCNSQFIPNSFKGQKSILNPGKEIQFIVAGGAQRDLSKPALTQSKLDSHDNPNSGGEILSFGSPGIQGSVIGQNFIWTPAADIETLDFSNAFATPVINKKVGTSESCPILTGVVALMKSRNPDLTINDIQTILAGSPTRINITHEPPPPTGSASGLTAADYTNQPFVDAWDAVEKSIAQRTGGSKSPSDYEAKDYFAIIDENLLVDKKITFLNKYAQDSASTSEKTKTLLRSVSDPDWNSLTNLKLVKLRGWTNLTAGDTPSMANSLEILDTEVICELGACSTSPATFEPQLDAGSSSVDKDSDGGFTITLRGKNLIAHSQSATPIHLELVDTSNISRETSFTRDEILDISNQGDVVKLKLAPARLDGTSPDEKRNVPRKNYTIRFKNTITNKTSNAIGPTGGFNLASTGSGFNLSSINPVPAGAIPGDFGVRMFFDPGLNGELSLRGGDYFGLFMLHQKYSNLRIEIQGQEAVITTPSNDFIKVRVPVGLAVGNHDILFKSDQGEFKLENAINYTSPFPQIVTLSKPAVFTNGVDTVDVTVKVEDANGNPAPDGSAYYVSLLGRNYTGNIINPDTGQQYGHERALPVSNGEIRFKVNSSYNVSPWEYTYNYSTSSFDAFTWPNPAAPSVQVRLCKAAYSSSKPGYGYYCAVQLFPQSGNTQEGRIYHVSAYEHNPLIVNVSPNGPRQEVVVNNLRDPLGNPLPEGTPVYMRQIIGGSGLLSREDGTSSSVMSFLSDTNGSVRFWYSPGPISCFSNGNGQDAISPLFASPTQVFGPSNPKEWLVGSPIIFRYPGC